MATESALTLTSDGPEPRGLSPSGIDRDIESERGTETEAETETEDTDGCTDAAEAGKEANGENGEGVCVIFASPSLSVSLSLGV